MAQNLPWVGRGVSYLLSVKSASMTSPSGPFPDDSDGPADPPPGVGPAPGANAASNCQLNLKMYLITGQGRISGDDLCHDTTQSFQTNG
nr:hypothetical protein Iba_chr14bCG1610 [Ipomoea batatas]